MASTAPVTGRLAPSPTGFLHLGNAWAFLLAWLAARSTGGTVILRLEDIDPQRSKPAFASAIEDDLHWLGLDWDQGPDKGGPHGPYVQSQCLERYATALKQLTASGLTYPCFCTRKELRQLAAAPHVDDKGAPYAGTCRQLSPERIAALLAAGRRPALRARCAEASVSFEDALMGPQACTLHDCGGDFALRRSDGVVAYQLAVVVDDAEMQVTQVVRGRDILPSTPRQIWLQKALGLATPQYVHIPLLLDAAGERLAKRHASLSLRALRQEGVRAEQIIGLLAQLARLRPHARPLPAAALIDDFSFDALPREDISLTARHMAILHP